VRSACGVPPIAIGESQDYNRATAQVAMEMAERGVFAPLRNEFDDRINRFIMPELGILHWKFRSGTPDLTNVEDTVSAIEAGVLAGVGSPNLYGQILSKIFKTEIPPNPDEWANFPIDLVKLGLQSGLVAMDFTGSGVELGVNEAMRDRFQEAVGECLIDAVDRALVLAREQVAAG
jgi:capsid portal protein